MGPPLSAVERVVKFPYPSLYRKLIHGVQLQTTEALQKTKWTLVFRVPFFESGITREWEKIEREVFAQPIYVVVGIFPRGHANPQEKAVFVHKPNHLFWKLFWAAFRLRGVTRTFLSLKHIKGFRLYKCDAATGLHERVDLDKNGQADLMLLGDTYKRWLVPRHIVRSWARWIHQEFNDSSHDVLEGKYSLELVLEWSATRITIVVFFPVLLSLAVGLCLNAKDWTDLATIQTACLGHCFVYRDSGWFICRVACCSKQHTWIIHHRAINAIVPLMFPCFDDGM
ncbi:hypothetical protein F5883DRAFT_112356 [Diaporthe sp. PMI_573]|nr:hypothetical protein F5883DRAFT_112356 [Diaporthaceae sp. PMI_573]